MLRQHRVADSNTMLWDFNPWPGRWLPSLGPALRDQSPAPRRGCEARGDERAELNSDFLV